MKFYITDVFSEGPYAGNQLATIPDPGDLSAEEMQKIAREFNFAETTFITGGSLENGFDVRIFTPTHELPFAGHPTLGTSYLIAREVIGRDVSEITLNLGVGRIPVTFDDSGILWMQQNPPAFGDVVDSGLVAEELGLEVSQVAADFPCQFVSTGLEFLLVPLASYDALKAARVTTSELARGYFVFCSGGYSDDQQIQARMFAAGMGVPEDPATGSANGCLAGYLAHYEFFGSSDVDIRVGQGYEIDRPSQLYLKSGKRPGPDGYWVEVGGRVRLVAKGEWLV